MFALLNKFKKNEDGIAVTELALVTPVFLLMFLSTIELGHMIYYSISIEKGLRSAVTYAGRVEEHTETTRARTINIVKTGLPEGGEYLVPGYGDPDAIVTMDTVNFYAAVSGSGEDVNEPVVRVAVEVPYIPVVGGVLVPALEFMMKKQFREGKLFIVLAHEQAIIGN